MRFLCQNQIDKYNHEMGNVDIADQLRVFYRMDHWLRNRKWWWAILFWALGVILTNSYVLYTKICDDEEVPKEFRYTHYEFLKEVGLYWMNPSEMENEEVVVKYGKGIFPHRHQPSLLLLLVHQRKHPRQEEVT